MPQLFWEARSKVERAEEHINDLNRTISEFIDTPNYVAFLERDVTSSHNLLKVRATKVLPARFNFVLGDAIHNLRTSLDYAMNEIELLTVGERTTYTKFPIFETAHTFKAAINGGLKEKAPKQVIECIEDFVQPYRRGNGEPLWCLHLLDIRDKHQLLIANTELTDVTGIRIKDDRGTEHILDTWRIIDHRVAGLPVRGPRMLRLQIRDTEPTA